MCHRCSMLPAIEQPLLAHRRDHAARVAAIGISAVDDSLLVHLKRIVARPVVALRLGHGPEGGRPAIGKGGTGQKAKEESKIPEAREVGGRGEKSVAMTGFPMVTKDKLSDACGVPLSAQWSGSLFARTVWYSVT